MKKTTFILPFIMLNLLSGIGSLAMFWWSNWDPIWIGVFFTTFPLPFLLMVLSQALKLARTSARLPLIQLLSFAGVAFVFYSLYTRGGPSIASEYVAAAMAVIGALAIQWFIWIFSPYKREKSASIVKGKPLPELPLSRLDGTEVTSSSFTGSKTLIVFFRANWCPFCMNQLKEVAGRADRLRKAGVQVKFISNQGVENSEKLAKDLKLPDNFEIFQDNDLRAAKTLGIEDIGGSPVGMPGYPADTVMATVVALDANGNVIFGDETDNYRVRPHPDTFLHVFE
ncbi:MAG: redoxin domain-containing protein [Pseudomonadota bacterium]